MVRTKILNMKDLDRPDFSKINKMFNKDFGNNWPQVPLRRWEYVAAILFSGVIENPGKVLEAGCGQSVFSSMLVNLGCDVDAFDYGLGIQFNTDNFRYHDMSMIDIRFKDNTFDYVFAISSIEHINAGRFKIDHLDFDKGDELAMAELIRVLKPGGILVITTDFADRYYPPPGLWRSKSHRIYNWEKFNQRLILPFDIEYFDEIEYPEIKNSKELKKMEPLGFAYTEFIATLKKKK